MAGTIGATRVAEFARGLPRQELEALLDLLPTPVLLIEPVTARVLFANAAADRVAGGSFPLADGEDGYDETYFCTDGTGARVPPDRMPGVLAARGERLEGYTMDWHLPHGVRSLLVSSDTIHGPDGEALLVIVAFDDVTVLRETERTKDEALGLLDTLFEQVPIGLAFFDRDLRYVRVNEALAEINGVPADDHVGRTVPEVLPEMDPAVVEQFREVMRTGEPLREVEVRGFTHARPGVERTWIGGWYPVRHRASGDILGLGAFVVEVTERVALLEAERRARERVERAERRTAFLATAGEVLSGSLNWEETLRRVARIAVPEKADWCAVDVVGQRGRIERLVAAHADPEVERAMVERSQRWAGHVDSDQGVGRVLRTGEPQLIPEVTDEMLVAGARDEEHLAFLRETGLRSAIVVPLVVRGRPTGALTFVMAESGRRFDEDDLALAVDVARLASTAIEHARLYRERDHIARTLQQSLLPPRLPDVPGFEVAGRYRAAGEAYEVGGDFYDLFEVSPGCWSVVVGDVCGKGPEAAALTALARYTLRAAALAEGEPAAVLGLLNDAILRERTDARFLTAVTGRLSLADDGGEVTLDLCAAGHPPAIVVPAGGGAPRFAGGAGRVLGLTRDADLSAERVVVEPGDVVVLHTDGVNDAGAPLAFLDAPEVGQVVADAARAEGAGAVDVAAALERRALEVAAGAPRDDIAILVLRRQQPAGAG